MVDADIDLVLERKEDGWWKLPCNFPFLAVELSVCLRFSDQLIHVEPACVGLQGGQYGFYEVSRLHQDANESHPKVESGGVYLPCFVAAKKTLAASDGQERLDVCIDQVAPETRICMELRDWTSCSCCMIRDTRRCCCCCGCGCGCGCGCVYDCGCWLLFICCCLFVVVSWLLVVCCLLLVLVCVRARFSYCPLAPETVNCESHQT